MASHDFEIGLCAALFLGSKWWPAETTGSYTFQPESISAYISAYFNFKTCSLEIVLSGMLC